MSDQPLSRRYSQEDVTDPFLMTSSSLPSEGYVPRTMPRILGSWDMIATFVMSMFLASTPNTAATGGPAAITYLAIGALTFFVPCVIATAQLGVIYPYEGSLYNWTHKAIGGWWSFFAGFCAWFPSVIISTSLGNLLVTYLQNLNETWLTESWQQGMVNIAFLLVSCILACQRFRTLQNVINILAIATMVAGGLIGIASLVWLIQGNPSSTDFGQWAAWQATPVNFSLFGFVALAYIGSEIALTLAGETKAGSERKIVKSHLFWGSIIILALYIVCTIALLVVLGPEKAASPLAMVTLVDTVFGKFLGNIALVCLMGSFLATSLIYNYVFARLLLVGGIDRRLPSTIAKLNRNRVPQNAIVFQTILCVAFVILTFIIIPLILPFEHAETLAISVYFVAQAAAILIWAVSAAFLFLDLVWCFIRDKRRFSRGRIFPWPVIWGSAAVGLVACLLAIINTLAYPWLPDMLNPLWLQVVGGITILFLILAAVGAMFANSEAGWQSMRSEQE